LIIGRGFLGNTIANVAKTKQVQVFEASQNSGILLDIKKIKTIEDTILEIDPDIIINCSAITDVDKIEEESKNAFEVNAYGVQNISKLSEKYSKTSGFILPTTISRPLPITSNVKFEFILNHNVILCQNRYFI